MDDAGQLWTIGHSTHSGAEFLALLQAHGIECVADVRRFPGSRRHPQFGGDALRELLEHHGIAYAWLDGLGGRRRPADASDAAEGSAWRNVSFRAYAQHMHTEQFAEGLQVLMDMGSACRTAMMCSEVLWWRCHRALISDALTFCGWRVMHIATARAASVHRYTSPARVVDGALTYTASETGSADAACC